MSDVTRRDAIKAVAVAGAVVAATGMAAGTAKAADDKGAAPAGWGKEGDQSFKLSEGMTPLKLSEGKVGLLSNNCDEIKEELRRRFQVVEFGRCDHPEPVTADVEAATVCLPKVIAAGAIINNEFGHRTVKNKVGRITFNTYLAYAGGDRP